MMQLCGGAAFADWLNSTFRITLLHQLNCWLLISLVSPLKLFSELLNKHVGFFHDISPTKNYNLTQQKFLDPQKFPY